MGIYIIKIRRPWNRPIYIMVLPVQLRHLYTETVSGVFFLYKSSYGSYSESLQPITACGTGYVLSQYETNCLVQSSLIGEPIYIYIYGKII